MPGCLRSVVGPPDRVGHGPDQQPPPTVLQKAHRLLLFCPQRRQPCRFLALLQQPVGQKGWSRRRTSRIFSAKAESAAHDRDPTASARAPPRRANTLINGNNPPRTAGPQDRPAIPRFRKFPPAGRIRPAGAGVPRCRPAPAGEQPPIRPPSSQHSVFLHVLLVPGECRDAGSTARPARPAPVSCTGSPVRRQRKFRICGRQDPHRRQQGPPACRENTACFNRLRFSGGTLCSGPKNAKIY